MKSLWLSLVLGVAVCVLHTNAEAAPIYTNLSDVVIQPYQPGLLVEFESVEPFRFGGFIGLDGTAHTTLDNPFDIGPITFDGKYYRISVSLPVITCGIVQVDADSGDFSGIGRLFTTGISCGGGGGGSSTQTFTQDTPQGPPDGPPDGPPTTPSSGTPVPEPPMWALLAVTAIAAKFWR